MTEMVDLRGVLRGLRRRSQVWLATFLVAIVAAGLFVVFSPTTYLAHARVVLPPSPLDAQGHDTRDIKTEVQIVRGAAVLASVTKAVQPSVELSALQRAISVRGVSSQIIEISAQSRDAARAAALANAVAASYVAYADDTATAEANAAASAYSQEVNQLHQQVQQLDQQIASNTAALTGLGPADARRREAVIDTLRSEQATLAQQLNLDQSRVADAQLQAQLSRQGTQVLQPALVPSQPASPKPLVDIGLGALAGLLIGGIVALAVEHGDHRLRSRDAISDAAGAPVVASMTVPRLDGAQRCRAFLEDWAPSVVESYALRQAFTRLGLGFGVAGRPAATLVLVGLADDADAAAMAVELAVFNAAGGTQTALVFASHDHSSAALRARCREASPQGLSPRPGLAIHGASGSVDPALLDGAELAVTFVVADAGPIVIPTWDRPTHVALLASAGRFTADRLEAVAAACFEAGTPLAGVFVVNPDPGDRSSGQRAVAGRDAGGTYGSARGHDADGGPGRAPVTATNGTGTTNGTAPSPHPAGFEVEGSSTTPAAPAAPETSETGLGS